MRKVTGLICAVSFGLLIAGCGGDQSGSAGTPGAASAAPTGFVVVPGQGMGGVRFGMTKTQVTAILGPPSHVLNEGKEIEDLMYGPWGFVVSVSAKSGVAAFGLNTARWTLQWSTSTFQGQTDKGIKIGSTREELVAAYGKSDDENAGPEYVSMLYKTLGLSFHLRNDRVEQFGVTRGRANRPVAGSTDSELAGQGAT